MCMSSADGWGKVFAPLNKKVDPVSNATNKAIGVDYDGKPKPPEPDPYTPATSSLTITTKEVAPTAPTSLSLPGQTSQSGLAIPK